MNFFVLFDSSILLLDWWTLTTILYSITWLVDVDKLHLYSATWLMDVDKLFSILLVGGRW